MAVALAACAVIVLVLGGSVAARLLVTSAAPSSVPALTDAPSAVVPSVPASLAPGAASPGASAGPHATAGPPAASSWHLPAGWRYDMACTDTELGPADCVLHLFDAAGREQDGWPVAVEGVCSEAVAVGPDNSVFAPCQSGTSTVITGLDEHGRRLRGWPATLVGEQVTPLQIDANGTAFVGLAPADRSGFTLHALAPDGSERPGAWPVALAGGSQGFTLAPDGTVVAWWYEGIPEDTIDLQARRTVFTMLAEDGTTLDGWPQGSKGAATAPVVWRDGSIFYTSASGKVWGLNRAGSRIKGWPHQLSEVVAPQLRSDGRLVFVGASRVDVLTRAGKVVAGWPYRSDASFELPGCDTPSFPEPAAVLAADDRLYLGTWNEKRSSVVALDPDGGMAEGWPYTVPSGWRLTSLAAGPDDTTEVGLAGGPCGADTAALVLSHDGRLLSAPPPTPLALVYERMRLEALPTAANGLRVAPGDAVGVPVALANRSRKAVELPRLAWPEGPAYAVGSIGTWIESLAARDLRACLPEPGEVERWYPLEQWPAAVSGPATIDPGSSIALDRPVALDASVTACLPPGAYRLHVLYLPLEGGVLDALDARSFDIEVVGAVAASPAPTPAWTATPPPPLPTATAWRNLSPSPAPAETAAP